MGYVFHCSLSKYLIKSISLSCSHTLLSLQMFRSAQSGIIDLVGAKVYPNNFKTFKLLIKHLPLHHCDHFLYCLHFSLTDKSSSMVKVAMSEWCHLHSQTMTISNAGFEISFPQSSTPTSSLFIVHCCDSSNQF